jgi:hypothetical protein
MASKSIPMASLSLLLLLIIIMLSNLSIVGDSLQVAHAQQLDGPWTWLWGESPPSVTISSTYLLRVLWITCDTPEDAGTDETVVKIFGDQYKQWGPLTMSAGQTRAINMEVPFSFSPARIEIWDYDSGSWWDKHDPIGDANAYSGGTRTITTLSVAGDGAHYTITFETLPL